jgi:hypothetical protein
MSTLRRCTILSLLVTDGSLNALTSRVTTLEGVLIRRVRTT